MRRTLRTLSTVLIIAGALLLVDAGLTVAWQEPVSALYARVTQDRLGGDLEDLENARLGPADRRALARLGTDRRRLAFLARSLKRRRKEGEAVGRIRIPAIGANFVLVDGTRPTTLRKGPGLFPEAPFPGAGGTTAVAGHRTTYSAPFRDIDRLRPRNRIVFDMPYARLTYRVERTRIVRPDALWVLNRVSYDRVILSACHPKYSAAKRIIVFARLERTELRGAARRA